MGMNSSTINNNLSSDYLTSMLENGGLETSGNSSKPGTENSLSTFAQLLGSAASSSASSTATGSSSNTNSPTQMMQQLMNSYRSGLQNQAASLDPMSIG